MAGSIRHEISKHDIEFETLCGRRPNSFKDTSTFQCRLFNFLLAMHAKYCLFKWMVKAVKKITEQNALPFGLFLPSFFVKELGTLCLPSVIGALTALQLSCDDLCAAILSIWSSRKTWNVTKTLQ